MVRAYEPGDGKYWSEERQRMIREFYEPKKKPDTFENFPFFGDEWKGDTEVNDAAWESVPIAEDKRRSIDVEEGLAAAMREIEDLQNERRLTADEHQQAMQKRLKAFQWTIGGVMASVAISVGAVIGYLHQASERTRIEKNLDAAYGDRRVLENEVRTLTRERNMYRDTLREVIDMTHDHLSHSQ